MADSLPVEGPKEVVEEVIEAKRKEDTEFGFRLPHGLDQQMGLLGSVMNANNAGGLLDQFLKGAKPSGTGQTSQNGGPQTAESPNKPEKPQGQPDFDKLLQQSMGMIGSVLNNRGGDVFGGLFGQANKQPAQQPEQEASKMYPKLDDLEETKPKPSQSQDGPGAPGGINLNLENVLVQGLDKLGLSNQLKDEVLGTFLGKPKQKPQEQQQQVYPNLDDLQGEKPKPKSGQEAINLEQLLNQGMDVIGSALKGNAGNVLNQLLNQAKPKTQTASQPHPPSAPEPEPLKAKSPEKVPDVPKATDMSKLSEGPKEKKTEEKSNDDKSGDEIIESIPEDAFIEAFDKLI